MISTLDFSQVYTNVLQQQDEDCDEPNIRKLERIISSMNDLIITIDSQGRIKNIFGKWFNEKHDLELKYAGKLIQDCFPGDEGTIHRHAFERALSGENYVYEWDFIHKEKTVYFQTSASLMIASHEPEVISVTRDITQLKEKTIELQEMTLKNQAMLAATAEGIIVVDKDGIITYVKDNVLEFIEVGEHVLGKTLAQLNKEYGVHYEVLAKYATEDKMIIELLYLKNENQYHFEVLKRTIKNGSEFFGYIISIRDVTLKKRAEERERQVYEAVSSGIVVQDSSGKTLFANRAASEILGYSLSQLKEMHSLDDDWKAIAEDGTPIPREMHPSMVTMRTQKEISGYVIGVFNPKLNQHRWLLLDTRIFYHNEDTLCPIESVITTFLDITEKKEWDRRMHQAEKLAVIGQLAAAMAHEIRNPLTSIDGFLKLLKPSLNSKEQMYLQILSDEVAKIDFVTNEFLTLAKPLDEKKIILHFKDEIIEPVMKIVQPSLRLNDIKLFFTYKIHTQPFILGHEKQLKRLVMNLIKNALEAMPDGGNIKIELKSDQDTVRLKIQDEGIGIPPERLKHIGEPFYSLKEKGTGLGIMICQKILKDHDGEMQISSKVYKGTTVEIKLPLIR